MADLKVFISTRDSTCDECGEKLGRQAWITLQPPDKALCLACADLDHLVFLSPGNAALTRRANKHSQLSAVVLKWSTTRKRYERQGLLVEADALESAEQECLNDQDARLRLQERAAAKRAEQDQDYLQKFAERVGELFPGCPADRRQPIAEHACLKYSGRIGRSAAAKSLDEQAVRLAVIAHIRHSETNYDQLLGTGWDRQDARTEVASQVQRVLDAWETNG